MPKTRSTIMCILMVILFFIFSSTLSALDRQTAQEYFLNHLSEHFTEPHEIVWIHDLVINQDVCSKMVLKAPPLKLSEFRANVFSDESIERGLLFLQQHAAYFDLAVEVGGNSEDFRFDIAATLRLESDFGRTLGFTPVLTRYFERYTRFKGDWSRKNLIAKEVVPFLRFAQANDWKVCAIRGSRASAIGLPQFMPFNLPLAVDGNDDGKIDIVESVPDAIMSIAHFHVRNGWRSSWCGRVRAHFNYNPLRKLKDAGCEEKFRGHWYVRMKMQYADELKKRLSD